MFPFRSFMGLAEVIHPFWVTFYIWCEVGSSFILCKWKFTCLSTLCWSNCSFRIEWIWLCCQKSAGHTYMGFLWTFNFIHLVYMTSSLSFTNMLAGHWCLLGSFVKKVGVTFNLIFYQLTTDDLTNKKALCPSLSELSRSCWESRRGS